jgi:hypothetical protein
VGMAMRQVSRTGTFIMNAIDFPSGDH